LHQAKPLQKCARTIITSLRSNGLSQYKALIASLRLHPKIFQIRIDASTLAKALDIDVANLSDNIIDFELPWQKKRRGVENKLIIGDLAPEPDLILIRMLAKAHHWVQEMKDGISLKKIAHNLDFTPAYIRTRSKLAFLSPKIQHAIVKGTLPPEFTTNQILSMKIPKDWQLQNTLFGV
jgi:site-specific DNA recombinase